MAKKSLIGTTFADTYLIEDRLGEGGMGTVYLAKNVRLGKKYALKVLNPEVANTYPGAVERFKREAVTAGRLGHVGIVQVHDIDQTEDGMLYQVMDLLEGEDLESRMIDQGVLSWEEIHKIITQTCDALATAHEAGIVHRDLKPANIFLSKRKGEGERAVLLDFGVAKVLDAHRNLYEDEDAEPNSRPKSTPTLTKPGTIVGTPNYMSPEQASGIGVDHRADIYSMGAVLYHMCTGGPPFDADSLLAVLTMIAIDPVPSIHLINPNVARPAGVDEVIAKAMAKKQENRYQDIRDLAGALPPPQAATVSVSMAVNAGMPIEQGSFKDTIAQPNTLQMYDLPRGATPGMPTVPGGPGTMQGGLNTMPGGMGTMAGGPGTMAGGPMTFEGSVAMAGPENSLVDYQNPAAQAEEEKRGLGWVWIVLVGLLLTGVLAGAVAALLPGLTRSNTAEPGPDAGDQASETPSKEVLYSRGLTDVDRAIEAENWAEAAGLISSLSKEFPQREATLRSMREQVSLEMEAAALYRSAKARVASDAVSARQLCDQIQVSSVYRKREPCEKLLKAPIKVAVANTPDASPSKTPGGSPGTKTPHSRPATLSDRDVQAVVRSNRGRAMRCFDRAFEGGYRPIGSVQVAVRVTIAETGRVTSARLLDSRHPTTASFRVCIENAVRGWDFPESRGMTTTEIPFTYRAPELDLDNL